jgi:NADPH:quinone reductase-like Zn-dependent oxidoreductase
MSSQTVFRFTSRDGIDALQAFKEPVPTAKEHEVVVKVRSVALNGRDIAIMNSTYPLPVKNQLIPCSDMAGEIVEVGGLVNGLSVGDSVIAPLNPSFLYGFLQDFHGFDTFGGLRDGVLREYIALPATAIIKLPKSSNSLTQWAAVVQAGSTVWNAFYGNKALKAGDTVLLLGMSHLTLSKH